VEDGEEELGFRGNVLVLNDPHLSTLVLSLWNHVILPEKMGCQI
jgi:hypothetical protein